MRKDAGIGRRGRIYRPERHYNSRQYSFLPDEILASLGTDTDSALARRFKLGRNTIKKARMARGIPRFRREAPPHLISRLGTAPDSSLAQEFDVPKHFVWSLRNERGIPPFEPQPPDDFVRDLGTMSDSDFARKHGVTVRSATYHRTKRGIESHRSKMSALRGVDSNPQR